jgi:type IV secretion system protein VirB8
MTKPIPPDDDLQQHLNELHGFITAHADIQAYLANSASWADGQAKAAEKSRRTAWRVATAAGMGAGLALLVALSAIVTSFRPAPPPEILSVNADTGQAERLVTLKDFQMTASEATIRRNLATFLRAREGYTWDTAEDHYYDAAAFMSPALQAQWAAYWDSANPKSPMNNYKKDVKVRVAIGAITINRNGQGIPITARASFTRTLLQNDVIQGESTQWIVTIAFGWVNTPTKERDRRVNDLGFEVTDYQVDADISQRTAGAATTVQSTTPTPVATIPPALVAPQSPATPAVAAPGTVGATP